MGKLEKRLGVLVQDPRRKEGRQGQAHTVRDGRQGNCVGKRGERGKEIEGKEGRMASPKTFVMFAKSGRGGRMYGIHR